MTVCIYFREMNGTVLTSLDAYRILRQYIPNITCIFIVESFITLLPFLSYFPKDIKFLPKKEVSYIEDDVLVTSAYIYHNIALNSLKLNINANKYLIFDSACFIQDEISNYGVIKLIKELTPEYIVLGNKFNSKYFDKDHYCIFTHPFDFSRLCNYKIKRKNIYTFSKKQRRVNLNPLEYSGFKYYRHARIGNIYYENIGRTLFEYLYMERPVYYSNKNKCLDDGLTQYLQMIGIDDNKEQIISFKKKEVQELFKFDYNTFFHFCR